MKTSTIWSIAAILLGISAFGIAKSFELLKKNEKLDRSMSELKVELTQASSTLKETNAVLQDLKASMREANYKNDQMEGQIKVLESKLTKRDKEIATYADNLALFSKKLEEASGVNKSLAAKNSQMANQMVRIEFEKIEMARKLSSIPELKNRINQLRKHSRVITRQRQLAQEAKRRGLKYSEFQQMLDNSPDGNRGYIVRDGESTFQDLVEIKVMAADEPAEDLR